MMSLGRVVIFCLAASLAAGCGGQRPPEPAKGDTPAPPEREKAGTTASAPEPSLLSPGVHEQTAALPGGGTLRYTISVPGGYDPEEQVPLVVALHDGGEVTPFCGRGMVDGLVGPAFADLGAVIVAPDSLGDDWTTDENEQAVVWLTGSVLEGYAIDPGKVLLAGYGTGGRGTWVIAGRHQELFTAALVVAGEPAGDAEWDIPICVIHSEADEVLPLAATQDHVERLQEAGVDVELRVVNDLRHHQTAKYAAPLREALPWLRKVWD